MKEYFVKGREKETMINMFERMIKQTHESKKPHHWLKVKKMMDLASLRINEIIYSSVNIQKIKKNIDLRMEDLRKEDYDYFIKRTDESEERVRDKIYVLKRYINAAILIKDISVNERDDEILADIIFDAQELIRHY